MMYMSCMTLYNCTLVPWSVDPTPQANFNHEDTTSIFSTSLLIRVPMVTCLQSSWTFVFMKLKKIVWRENIFIYAVFPEKWATILMVRSLHICLMKISPKI